MANKNASTMSPLVAQLAESGVRDVKFFFQPNVAACSISEAKESVKTILTAYLAGDFVQTQETPAN